MHRRKSDFKQKCGTIFTTAYFVTNIALGEAPMQRKGPHPDVLVAFYEHGGCATGA